MAKHFRHKNGRVRDGSLFWPVALSATIALLLVVVAVTDTAGSSALQIWEGKYGDGWIFDENDNTGTPSHIYGKGVYIGEVQESGADSRARAFIEESVDVLGVDTGNLKLVKVEEDEPLYAGLGKTYAVSYRQTYQGLPVINSYVNMFISDNQIVSIDKNYYGGIGVSTVPLLNQDDARRQVMEKFNLRNEFVLPKAQLVVFPEDAGGSVNYRLAYRTDLPFTANPFGLWTVFVDANTGEVVGSFNRIVFADDIKGTVEGSVFPTHPGEPQVTAEFAGQNVFVSGQPVNRVFHSGRGNSYTSIMASDIINLTEASSAQLSFETRFNMETGTDSALVFIFPLIPLPDGEFIVELPETLAVFTGVQDSWVGKEFDLNRFIGKVVVIVFAYGTDESIVSRGFFLDNIHVITDKGTVFFDDAESGGVKWFTPLLGSFSIVADELAASAGRTEEDGDYKIRDVSGGLNLFSALSGSFVDVDNMKNDGIEFIKNVPDRTQTDALHSIELSDAEHDWSWREFDASYKNEESNVFYHTNIAHDYFTQGSPFDFADLNFPMQANVEFLLPPEVLGVCNAFATTFSITFLGPADGCESTALARDIIYHEYTHIVVFIIYSERDFFPIGTDFPAMNEGWADYFAATITNDPGIGEGVYGEPLSVIDNTLRFPDNLTGEPHADSRIFSGAMWDLRKAVGSELADSLIIRTMKLRPVSFSKFLSGLLIVDDDNANLADGTPHMEEICAAFSANHGIMSDFCSGVK